MCLEDEDNDPVYARHDGINAEAAGGVIILSPDCVAVVMLCAVGWLLECVECAGNDEDEPGNNGQDLVGQEVSLGEFLAFGEWVVCSYTVSWKSCMRASQASYNL